VSAEIHSVAYDPVVKRLLERMLELERTKAPDDPSEAQYGEHSQQTDNRGAGNVNTNTITEHSRLLPWLMMCAVFSGFAIAFSMFTFYQLTRTEREYKLVQLQLMDQNAILIREGLKQPTDLVNGPAGNYQYDPSKSPKRK
jgi:hypothetical protein